MIADLTCIYAPVYLNTHKNANMSCCTCRSICTHIYIYICMQNLAQSMFYTYVCTGRNQFGRWNSLLWLAATWKSAAAQMVAAGRIRKAGMELIPDMIPAASHCWHHMQAKSPLSGAFLVLSVVTMAAQGPTRCWKRSRVWRCQTQISGNPIIDWSIFGGWFSHYPLVMTNIVMV